MTAPAAAVPRTSGGIADRLLGRATMYRVVLVALAVLAAGAVLFGAVGVLPFGVPDLLASLAVAVLVAVGSNRLFALLWRVRTHTESSVITGLLGFFLFLPGTTLQSLGPLALAVSAANLSKYVLAVRGRHVLNPIAAGAVVVALTGIGGAGWWVATPALLPFVLIGGALVVRRAGAWDLALPLVAVAVPGVLIGLLAAGTEPVVALTTALASYPTLFLAAFMMTEPLTAPPRRWQRVAVAALVGLLTLLPLRVGFVVLSPEIALVLGNAVAFAFGQRRRVRLTLERRTERPGGIEDLLFRSEAPLRLLPGQYVELSLPHAAQDARGARRAFSPANAPGTTAVRVVTRRAEPSSSFKRALADLRPGAEVAGAAVAGDFLPPRDPAAPVLWIAGGIGVTPFTAMAAARASTDARLVWSVREGEDLEWVREATGALPVDLVGPGALADPAARPPGWGYAGERLTAAALAAAVPDLASRTVYAAGSPALVSEARAAARAAGARRVRTDRFLGY